MLSSFVAPRKAIAIQRRRRTISAVQSSSPSPPVRPTCGECSGQLNVQVTNASIEQTARCLAPALAIETPNPSDVQCIHYEARDVVIA
jgi:hypothetical protein